jgi:hypothetical protein
VSEPQPPLRPPHYFDNESHSWSLRDCARNLISTLAWWCKQPRDFKGSANGRVWWFQGDYDARAQLLFTSNQGDGTIELSIDESGWVRAELFIAGALKLRAWIDEPYEEKEFWPDGSDCKRSPDGDAAGRISKRSRWLIIRCADFPGAPPNEYGYWDVEDTFD